MGRLRKKHVLIYLNIFVFYIWQLVFWQAITDNNTFFFQ